MIAVIAAVAAAAMLAGAQDTRPSRPPRRPASATQPADQADTRPATRPSRRGRLTDAQIAELLGWLQVNQPNSYRHAMALRREDERHFHAFMSGIARLRAQIEDMPADLQRRTWRIREDNVKIAELLKQHEAAESAEAREAVVRQLRDVVDRQFEDTQKLKEYQLRLLARQLDDLRQQLVERLQRREEFINQRVADLLNGDDPDDSPATRPTNAASP